MSFTSWRNCLVRIRVGWTGQGERLKVVAAMAVALVVATTCLLGMLHHDTPEHWCAFAATDSCPTFASITSRSLRVTWRPPSSAYHVRRYELYAAETYASAGEGGSSPSTKVYSGLKRSVELKDLSPSTSYNFTVKIIGYKDSIRSSCWRFTKTLGDEDGNLLANPSFEEVGGPLTPQMDYGDQLFATHWEPLMMPYSLKLLPKRGRTWYTHSNDAPNKRAAHQWVPGLSLVPLTECLCMRFTRHATHLTDIFESHEADQAVAVRMEQGERGEWRA